MDINRNFYLHVEQMPGALPLSVTVVWFPKAPPYVSTYITTENQQILDNLYDSGGLLFEHEWVYPTVVNRIGYRKACRYVIEKLIPKLCLKTKVIPEMVYTPCGTPTSFHYPCKSISAHKVSELNIAKLIGITLKKEDIKNIWHPHLPIYGWNRNLGRLDTVQTLACLETGINTRHHYIEELKRIPYLWVRQIKQHNPRSLMGQDYSKKAPKWWRLIFQTNNFFKFMSAAEKKAAVDILKKAIPHTIYTFYKPLKLDAQSGD